MLLNTWRGHEHHRLEIDMKLLTQLLAFSLAIVWGQLALAAPTERFCFACARPDIDWHRYANVAHNVYFKYEKLYEGKPQNRIVGDQILISGGSGCLSRAQDWVLIDLSYNWENLGGEVHGGPFGGGITIPVFSRNIEWTAQIPDGTQRSGFFLANSPLLLWKVHLLPYPPGATDCGVPEEPDEPEHYLSVYFPWADGGECQEKDSVFEQILCAVQAGFECLCGNPDGHYTCLRPEPDNPHP